MLFAGAFYNYIRLMYIDVQRIECCSMKRDRQAKCHEEMIQQCMVISKIE